MEAFNHVKDQGSRTVSQVVADGKVSNMSEKLDALGNRVSGMQEAAGKAKRKGGAAEEPALKKEKSEEEKKGDSQPQSPSAQLASFGAMQLQAGAAAAAPPTGWPRQCNAKNITFFDRSPRFLRIAAEVVRARPLWAPLPVAWWLRRAWRRWFSL